jgi:hypothetical protein
VKAITPREASIFACFTDTVVAPEPVLPAVKETDAAGFFDLWMQRSPRRNRVALRGLLYAIELSPLLLHHNSRLRKLPAEDRARWLRSVESARWPQVRQLAKLVKGIAFLAYYGDNDVMLRIGYDAQARVDRGRELRALEGRP